MQEKDNMTEVDTKPGVSKKVRRGLRLTKSMRVGVILVLLAVLVLVGVLTQRIAIAVMPNSSARVVASVCGADDVANFNEHFVDESFKTTITAIEKRPNYNNDATCVYIEYRYSYDRQQYTKVRERAARVEQLVNDGNFIDSRIIGVENVAMIRQSVDAVKDLSDGKSVDGE